MGRWGRRLEEPTSSGNYNPPRPPFLPCLVLCVRACRRPEPQGQFAEAAKAFAKAGLPERAVDMYADLRRWDDAMTFANQGQGGGIFVRRRVDGCSTQVAYCSAVLC